MYRHASMNKAYRTVWNHVRQCYMVVGENARSRGKTSSRKVIVEAVTAALLALGAGQALAATDCSAVAGSTITIDGAAVANCALEAGDVLTVSGTGSISDGSVAVSVDGGVGAGSISVLSGGTIAGGASGILIGDPILGAGTITGGITNGGLIQGTDSSAISVIGVDPLNTPSTIGGSIVNLAGGTLAGGATGVSNGVLYVTRSEVSGGIKNSGLITTTSATVDRWAGLYINGANIGTLAGGNSVENTNTTTGIRGTLSVSGSTAVKAFGISILNSTLAGGVANSGAIALTAIGGSDTGAAHGIYLNDTLVNGSVVNSGAITLAASNPDVSATAMGINIWGSSTITGGVTNSGTITASASASGNTAEAYGIKVDNSALLNGTVAGDIVNDTGKLISVSGIADGSTAYGIGIGVEDATLGSIINRGTISAYANGSNSWYATGISVKSSSLTGSIVNSGSITGQWIGVRVASNSTIDQGITNSGSGVIIGTDGYGIEVENSVLTGALLNEGSVSGSNTGIRVDRGTISAGLTNTGKIIGLNGSSSSGTGIKLDSSTVTGGLANSGTIVGGESGIYMSASVIDGDLLNASVSGTVLGTISGAGSYGVRLNSGSTITGALINRGLITSASDTGIRLSSDSEITSGITNSGTIIGESYAIFSDAGATLPSIVNESGGLIQGNLDIQSTTNFNNAGTWKPAVGNSTITGNFTNTGTFSPVVSNMTTYGKLVVDGTANLGGTLAVDAASATGLTDGTLSGVIHATTAVSGTFATVSDNSALFDFSAAYGANDVNLVLAAATGGGGGTPGVLDAVTNTGNTPGTGAANALDQIIAADPTNPVSLLFIGLTTDQEVSDAVSETLPLLTGGQSQAMGNALHGVNRIVQSRQEGQHGRSSGDQFFGDEHVWFKPFGSWANQDNRKGVSGYDANTYGMVFGMDGEISETNRIGAAFAYARSDVESNSNVARQSADVDTYQLVVYGSHSLSPETEISYQADYGRHNTEGQRRITFAGATAQSDYDSWSAHAGIGLAHTYSFSDKTSLTPTVRIDYTRLEDDSYREKGAGALNLKVNDNSTEELILSVDGKLAHALSDKATFTANLGVGYDIINEQASITAAFAGAPTASFVTKGLDPSPWLARAGLGIVGKVSDRLEVTARYDAEVRQDFDNQTASVKFRWAF